MTVRTWHIELLIVAVILCTITFFTVNNITNWITTAAILFTFNHGQIGDRLQERQAIMTVSSVECFRKLNKLFAGKEILWIAAFLLMHNYAAIVGSVLFFLYPLWRKFYRNKIKPII